LILAYQLLLSIVMIVAVYATARSFAPHNQALLASGFAAVDPLLTMYGVTISSEAMYVPLVAVALGQNDP
jgi:uncharacterized membrane protein